MRMNRVMGRLWRRFVVTQAGERKRGVQVGADYFGFEDVLGKFESPHVDSDEVHEARSGLGVAW